MILWLSFRDGFRSRRAYFPRSPGFAAGQRCARVLKDIYIYIYSSSSVSNIPLKYLPAWSNTMAACGAHFETYGLHLLAEWMHPDATLQLHL